jgi:HSP90 family molecular chaperone
MDTANDKATETLPFQAEMKQVLDLFIRSLVF